MDGTGSDSTWPPAVPASEGGAAVGGGKGHYRPAAMYAGEGASKVGSFFFKILKFEPFQKKKNQS